ncbi:malate dehydrogenase, partial [Methylococcaceae bacterium CS2]
VISDGSYGVEKGLFFSFPVQVSSSGEVSIVQELEIDDFSKSCIKASVQELKDERKAIKHLL